MSVSKIHHDSIPFEPDPAQPLSSSREPQLKIVTASFESDEFWTEFHRTMDDFFATINKSKVHIQRLTNRLADRDNQIEQLLADNALLRDRLESQTDHPRPVPPAPKLEPSASDETPAEVRARRSIWSRLSGLEQPTPPFDAFDERKL